MTIISVTSTNRLIFLIQDAPCVDRCKALYPRRVEYSRRSVYTARSELNFHVPGVSEVISHTRGERSLSQIASYNQKYLYAKLNSYGDNGEMNFKESEHVMITKYLLKRGGICSSCNVDRCA